jgi:hypothetical protein
MASRPLVLHGSEKHPQLPAIFDDPAFTFNGKKGLWIDRHDHPAVLRCGAGQSTTKTATREGIDQTELAGFGTTITKTREGLDQSEVAAPGTLITNTKEGVDQAEVANWRSREPIHQTGAS